MRTFSSLLQPAPLVPAFVDDAWWTWCGSVVRDAAGRCHLFASRWPRELPFFNGYLAGSRIVQAVADGPLGPFKYVRDVLPTGDRGRWDGTMAHNPAIMAFGGRYYLFYIGLRADEPRPALDAPFASWRETYRRIRIGVAVADALDGKFVPTERPVIDTDVAPWPHVVATNPAPVITPEGKVRVYYRTPRVEGDRVRNVLAIAEADHPLGPYRAVKREPMLPTTMHLEDPFVWHDGTCYQAIAKDLDGNVAGAWGGGVHLLSEDGLEWRLAPEPVVHRRELVFADGARKLLGNVERPSLLRSASGVPEVLYAAVSDDPRGFHHATRTWLQAIPLSGV